MAYGKGVPDLIHLLTSNPHLWLTATIVSVVLFIGTLVAIPIVCVRLPADYFVRPMRPQVPWRMAARTAVACIVILMGVAMLVLPGQGILTILIGVSLLDFPAKRAWQRRLLRRPSVLRALNAMRMRAGKPPFRT